MKRFTLVFALISVFGLAYGQRAYLDGVAMNGTSVHFMNGKAVTDTLAPLGILNASAYRLFNSTGGGYVCGNNGYGDVAKGQQFLVNQGYKIEGVLIWVGAKEINGSAGTLNVTLNQLNGTATTTAGTGEGPGTVFNTTSLSMSLIDTSTTFGTFATFMFPNASTVLQDYCVVFDMMQLGDDTIGVVSCEDGDAQGAELTFDKWSDNSWHTFLEPNNWAMDIDMAIFPLVDLSTAGINEGNFVNGIKMDQNMPNPVFDQTEIRFEIESTADVKLFVTDINGRIVRVIEAGQLDAGLHNISLDLGDLSSGTYFYSIQAGKNRLSKRMQVAH